MVDTGITNLIYDSKFVQNRRFFLFEWRKVKEKDEMRFVEKERERLNRSVVEREEEEEEEEEEEKEEEEEMS